ncbi:MAG: hypothetical protein BWX84_02268 [Verrucomicrobia bacterium ADurb.Bin118]|nr:MAG: hypothetical protein BWX84_02268 [Verrucomicrobia bacterium ADurb.Bin118]
MARRATSWPTRAMTADSFKPAAQLACSHARICATLMTGLDMKIWVFESAYL